MCEPAPVAEAAHQEQAAAAALLQVIGAGGIVDFHRIEAWPLVGHPDGQRVFPATQGNGNMFGAVALVSVQHGIGDCLGQADQNIAMQIIGKVVAPRKFVYERFHLTNIIGVRR